MIQEYLGVNQVDIIRGSLDVNQADMIEGSLDVNRPIRYRGLCVLTRL